MHCGVRFLDVLHSIAKEAEAEAARLVPAAESAIQKARQAAVTPRGQPQELTLPYLHDLATSRLHSWLSAQKDVTGFQVAPQQTAHLDVSTTCKLHEDVSQNEPGAIVQHRMCLVIVGLSSVKLAGNTSDCLSYAGCIRVRGYDRWARGLLGCGAHSLGKHQRSTVCCGNS